MYGTVISVEANGLMRATEQLNMRRVKKMSDSNCGAGVGRAAVHRARRASVRVATPYGVRVAVCAPEPCARSIYTVCFSFESKSWIDTEIYTPP